MTFKLTETNLREEAAAQVMDAIERQQWDLSKYIGVRYFEMDDLDIRNEAINAVRGYMQDWYNWDPPWAHQNAPRTGDR